MATNLQDQTKFFQLRLEDIQTSFTAIKDNPLNLNLLMSHIGILSLTLHDIISVLYPITTENTNDETDSKL